MFDAFEKTIFQRLKKKMMEEIMNLQVIDRFLDNEMSQEEIDEFNKFRNEHASFDQLVVSHSIFRKKLQNFADTTAVKNTIFDAHIDYQLNNQPVITQKARIIQLFERYKKTIAVAASVALIFSLATGGFFKSINSQDKLIGKAQKEAENNQKNIARINDKLTNIEKQIQNGNILGISSIAEEKIFEGNSNGTGFLLNTEGFVATNYHVISDVKELRLENKAGIQYNADILYKDEALDLAILKINDPSFTKPIALPYKISKFEPELAEDIFTLGFPREEIVYSEGYVSANLGFNGDKNDCQMYINANPGNSGGPVITRHGKMIGMIKSREKDNKGNVFALKAVHISKAMDSVLKMEAYKNLKINQNITALSTNKVQQVKTIGNFIYNIRVAK